MSSTPGTAPGGTAASRDSCMRADGSAWSSHFAARSSGACRQQDGSGHPDCERICDSRPSNQRTWENGTPTLMAMWAMWKRMWTQSCWRLLKVGARIWLGMVEAHMEVGVRVVVGVGVGRM